MEHDDDDVGRERWSREEAIEKGCMLVKLSEWNRVKEFNC